MRSSAFASTGLTWYGSHGTPNIIYRKFSAYFKSLRGYMNGWPVAYLKAIAAIVGTLATNR